MYIYIPIPQTKGKTKRTNKTMIASSMLQPRHPTAIPFQSTAVIGWVVTWVVGVFLCYITFTKRREGGEEWPRWWEALYESVGRPAWAACVAWIIYACHNNRGGAS